ncbi:MULTISPECIES: GTP-binding protein [unclassified Pseudomonas]|uniref:CobW family GTP-binding protein n=1 Tax=unclassified Pseudomonas TaxID=196821 RepID=UPI000BDABED8|nr:MULTISPECIES: CobW family GTP-binding protein [unclassified Pseudomonas]PVZ10502.1 G3E family GTPase [Pseudomonas sp. URIL14HWK12:I12]PVZ21928.1 G3E family GTPase [Pseudomonas sp. URIL14HWK12:I10]PVZ30989.1 G3E family GTPase [Pseudomonas sp. URIL14HWK12:I11]SNZ17496.1 GTPase, G3E family [Pseudomonas sp. URIL14HWK12:I9]
MLSQITTHLIAGPLGAGKTSLIRQLLANKPAAERWAVLINEFGQVGLDAALLATDASGIGIAEVAGGCLCCVNGLPFQVGLGRLLRKAKPTRLFIEASGLGHPISLLEQLRREPWAGVLNVQPLVLVLDAAALARGEPLPDHLHASLAQAGRVFLSKADQLPRQALAPLVERFGVGLAMALRSDSAQLAALPENTAPPAVDNPTAPLPFGLALPNTRADMQTHEADGHFSVGKTWPPEEQFDPETLTAALNEWPWLRAKGVIHSPAGWVSVNAVQGQPWAWSPSLWKQDNRLEVIFDHAQNVAMLAAALEACRLAQG